MELHEALQLVKFDKRLLDWHVRQGIISTAEIENYIKSLPDCAAQSMAIDIENEDTSDFEQ